MHYHDLIKVAGVVVDGGQKPFAFSVWWGMVDGSNPNFFILFSELGSIQFLFLSKIVICLWPYA